MLISVLLIALVAFAGLVLTYLVGDDEPLLWRISAGIVVGSAIFGTVAFVGADVFGFNALTVSISLLLTALPAALVTRHALARIGHDG